MPPVKRPANVLDDIFDLEAQMEQGTPPAGPQDTPSMQGGPTGRTDMIRVPVQGIPEPLEFEPGTSPDVIQSVVKQVTANQPTSPNLPHLAEGMGAAGAMGGARVGMSGGALMPIPGGAAGGAMIGAVAGGAGGHLVGQTVEDMANGVDFSIDRLASNALDASKYGLMSGVFEPIGGFLKSAVIDPMKRGTFGAAGAWLGNKLFVPKTQSDIVKKSEEVLAEAGAPGLTAGQLSGPNEKTIGKIAENIAVGSMTTNVVNTIRNRQQQGLKDYVANLQANWSQLDPKDAADTFKWAVNDNWNTLYKKPMDLAMQDLRDTTMAEGITFNATPILRELQSPNSGLSKFMRTVMQKERESNPAVFDKLIALITPAKKGKQSLALPDLTFDEASELKTALREIGDKSFTDAAGKQMAISAKTLSTKVDTAIRSQLVGTPDLARSYASSMEMYAQGLQSFRNDAAQKFMQAIDKEPGAMASLLIKPGQTEFIANLKSMVGEQMWKDTVEPRLGATILYKSFGPPNAKGQLGIEGALSGTKLATELQRLAQDGTAQALLSDKTYRSLLDLAKVIDHVGNPVSGAGKVFIQLAQAGAVGAIVGGAANYALGGDTKTSGMSLLGGVTILMAPRMLGKLVARPEYIEAFKHGIQESSKTGKPTPRLLDLMNQLAAQETTRGLLSEPTAPSPDTKLPRAKLFPQRSVTTTPQPQAAPTPE